VDSDILCVSIDGIDGSGKSKLIQSLSLRYNLITLPKFYNFGMVPVDAEKRKTWFRSTPAIDSMRLYAVSHQTRILLGKEYKKANHYQFITQDDRQKLVVFDRGILSVEAYIYAALKLSTSMSLTEIIDYINNNFRSSFYDEMNDVIDRTILLADGTGEYLNTVLKRRRYDNRDKMLIRYQSEYIQNKFYINKNVFKLSPIHSPYDLLELSIKLINQKEN
jgi:thymidylate kinase